MSYIFITEKGTGDCIFLPVAFELHEQSVEVK
jgi:hypothetical protein